VTLTADYGRTAVYAAEQQLCRVLDRFPKGEPLELFGSQVVLPVETKFNGLTEVQTYLQQVLKQPDLIRVFGELEVPAIRERRGQTKAHYEYETQMIALPLERGWALREIVVLHELAHYIVHQKYPKAQAHGREFARTHRLLIEWMLGVEVAWLLGIAFADAGVEH
jgi:putative metallohydrolase (TIGR04338 family)